VRAHHGRRRGIAGAVLSATSAAQPTRLPVERRGIQEREGLLSALHHRAHEPRVLLTDSSAITIRHVAI